MSYTVIILCYLFASVFALSAVSKTSSRRAFKEFCSSLQELRIVSARFSTPLGFAVVARNGHAAPC